MMFWWVCMNDLIDLPIEDAAPHILRRPILYIEPNPRMLQAATFLAIDPEIYVDGLLVVVYFQTSLTIWFP